MQTAKLGLAVFPTLWLKMVPLESLLRKISTESLFNFVNCNNTLPDLYFHVSSIMNFRLKKPQQLWATVDRITCNDKHQIQEVVSACQDNDILFNFLEHISSEKPLALSLTFFSHVICFRAVH